AATPAVTARAVRPRASLMRTSGFASASSRLTEAVEEKGKGFSTPNKSSDSVARTLSTRSPKSRLPAPAVTPPPRSARNPAATTHARVISPPFQGRRPACGWDLGQAWLRWDDGRVTKFVGGTAGDGVGWGATDAARPAPPSATQPGAPAPRSRAGWRQEPGTPFAPVRDCARRVPGGG